ncbi:MarR family winged helix-turn-helix transcriptional regulator [Candidimonas nitroreducens]|nr:MarR family winged helix-turn-helix transcriptional regulator [Candidimonas nitroreducens]
MHKTSARAAPAGDPLLDFEDADLMPVERFVTFKVNQLSTAFERQWTRIMREKAGVSLSQWRVLVMLQAGPATFSRLVEATGMNKALMSRSISELEAKRMLTVSATPDDARSITLTLAAKGRKLLQEVQPLALARQRHLLSALSASERRTFYAALDKLARAAAECEGWR